MARHFHREDDIAEFLIKRMDLGSTLSNVAVHGTSGGFPVEPVEDA